MNLSAAQPGLWIERYETLRSFVLEGQQRLQSQPLGLALWLSKGMAGWMSQWSLLSQASPQATKLNPPPPCASAAPWQQQLTVLLAQMTLSHLQPHYCL